MLTILICETCSTEYALPAGDPDWPACANCGGHEYRAEYREDTLLDGELRPLATMGIAPLLKGVPRVIEKAERVKAKAKNQQSVYARVDRRDNWRCRSCQRAVDVHSTEMLNRGHRHHIRFRSQGGPDETSNICVLCAFCHSAIHAHQLTVTGNADSTLMFSGKTRGKQGEWESAA